MTENDVFTNRVNTLSPRAVKLRPQDKKFSQVLNSIDAVVYVTDMKNHEIVFINAYGKDIWGDVKGKICWQVFQAEQMGPCEFCTNHKLVGPDGNPTEGVAWEIRNTVNNRWYDCRDRAIYWPDGRIVRLEIATDITDRKQIEQKLLESEANYRSSSTLMRMLCDNVPDMIWAKDLDKRYVFVNQAICRQLLNATDTDEPIGKTDLFFAERERLRQADNPEWHTFGEICRDTDDITMDAGTPQQFDEYGNVQGKFLFLDVHKAPFKDENGSVIGTVGSARNVTAPKEIETKLKQSAARLREVLENSLDVHYKRNLQTNAYDYLSPVFARISGYTPDEMKSLPLEKIRNQIHPDDLPKIEHVFSEFMSDITDRAYRIEYRFKHKNGQYLWFQDQFTVMRDVHRQPLALIGSVCDITESKLAKEMLRESEEQYRLLFESSSDALFLVAKDTGVILDVNIFASDLYGYDPAELLTMKSWDLSAEPEETRRLTFQAQPDPDLRVQSSRYYLL